MAWRGPGAQVRQQAGPSAPLRPCVLQQVSATPSRHSPWSIPLSQAWHAMTNVPVFSESFPLWTWSCSLVGTVRFTSTEEVAGSVDLPSDEARGCSPRAGGGRSGGEGGQCGKAQMSNASFHCSGRWPAPGMLGPSLRGLGTYLPHRCCLVSAMGPEFLITHAQSFAKPLHF